MESTSGISIVLPAFNEAKILPQTLKTISVAIDRLSQKYNVPAEVIVVDNASTDETVVIAESLGARVIPHPMRNISSVCNAGVRAAKFDTIVRLDSDSWVPAHAFVRVWEVMTSGKHIGGGVHIRVHDAPLWMKTCAMAMDAFLHAIGIPLGMIFFERKYFEAVGGFFENRLVAEDGAFAKALRDLGRTRNLTYCRLHDVTILTSGRKASLGLVKNIEAYLKIVKVLQGKTVKTDELSYWYNPPR